MFRRNIASVIADLPVDGWKWENPLNRCDLSAKGRLPDVYLLTKIPLIYYKIFKIDQIGKSLLDYAVGELMIKKVDVNEQNKNALEFYKKYGFVVYERTNKDNDGKNYPILKMRLE